MKNKLYKRVVVNRIGDGDWYDKFRVFIYTPTKQWVADFKNFNVAQKFAATLRKHS